MGVLVDCLKDPTCPKCRKQLTGATCVSAPNDRQPTTGDLTICYYCRTGLAYTDIGTLRLANTEELSTLRDVLRQLRMN